MLAAFGHQKQHCGMITKVPTIHHWVASVHKAGGQRLPEQPGLQHTQESTRGSWEETGLLLSHNAVSM